MKKPSKLVFTIDLPDNHNAARLSVQSDGSIRLFDAKGNEVDAVRTMRSMQYERPKGPKYQTKATSRTNKASVGGLEELASLDHFIVLDTNTKQIAGGKISAAFFIACRLRRHGNKYEIQSLDNCGHVYEFHNTTGNPEMLAILRLQNDIMKFSPGAGKVAFITDSELGRHESISSRSEPIYGNVFLNEKFTLIYASSDTGQELTNQLIRFCDAQSSKHLKTVEQVGLNGCKVSSLPEDLTTQYRFITYNDLKISNPEITGVELAKGSTVTVLIE